MATAIFVDDEPDLCELYEENYSSQSFEVKAFTDLAAAEKRILEDGVKIVFIDYRLAEFSGVDFRKKLPQEVPCYLLTGEFVTETPAGFLEVLQKPLRPEVFEAILRKHHIVLHAEPQEFDPYRALFAYIQAEVHIWKVVRSSSGKIQTWTLIDANRPALTVWKKKIEEIVGKTTEEIFPHSNAVERFMPVVEKIFKEGRPHTWREYFKGTGQILEMTSIPCGEYFISIGGGVQQS